MDQIIQIRAMQQQDIGACATIVANTALFARYQFGGSQAREQLTRAHADDAQDLRIAEVSQQIVGFSWVATRGAFMRSPYLRLIAVDPGQTARGVGGRLLQSQEADHLDQRGFFLLTNRDNLPAQKFYQKHGYRHLADLPDYVVAGEVEQIWFKHG